MHFAFIPYGKRSEVELLLRDMEAQKHILPMKKGKEEIKIHIQGQVRILPGGVMEYVFPREDLDLVLNSLIIDTNRYELPSIALIALKKTYHLEALPKTYKKDKSYLWVKDNVNIIPLGIRKDIDIVGNGILDEGFKHEAI
jgi:hypothetical protein